MDLGEDDHLDPDPQVSTRPGSGRRRPQGLAAGAALLAILVLGVALRVARFHAGDYYEDGASHWWTAAYAFETGLIVDPFGLNHLGYWLPGYDPLAASLMSIAGTTSPDLLRGTGVAAWVGAAACLYAFARPAGAWVALFATLLFALSPFDILNTAITAGVELSVALLLLGILLARKAREGHPALLWGAALAFSMAVLFRYEGLVFVVAYLMHGWWWKAGSHVDAFFAQKARPFLFLALAIAAGVLMITWGENFISRLLVGPPPDYSYAEAQGLVARDPFVRGANFWLVWGPMLGVGALLMLFGLALHLGRVESWLVVTFCALLTVFLFAGLGTASFRYLAPVEPLMWVLAALALRRIAWWASGFAARLAVRDVGKAVRAATALALGALVITSSASATFTTLSVADDQIALNGPLERAATYVRGLPQDDHLLVLIDSPVAAQASGLSASRMIGSALLPDSRDAAMDVLRERVQYVVAVNVSYYRLMVLFPELSMGRSNENFSLLYDATDWEARYTPKTAWVYEINRDHAVISVGQDLFLHVPTAVPAGSPKAGGLRLWSHAVELTAGTMGLGAPELRAAGKLYLAHSATGAPVVGSSQVSYRVTYSMLPLLPGGSVDESADPAVVVATYDTVDGVVNVTLTVERAPGPGPTTLVANNSVPVDKFPLFANSSYPEPVEGPIGQTRVWSLRNWLEGDGATIQVDYRSPLTLVFGRDGTGTTWLSQAAPEGATSLEFRMTIFAAGEPPYGPGEPVTLEGPLRRAGGFLATLTLNDSLRVLTEWAFGPHPWVLEASGLSAGRFANISELPADRPAAQAWLLANIEYVVVVNTSGDRLLALFPELAAGDSDTNFSISLYDRGPPGSAVEPDVWVYRVNNGDGWVSLWAGAMLRFIADQGGPGRAFGVEVWLDGAPLAEPAPGLGVPSAVVNGTRYTAASAAFSFLQGSGGHAFVATWTLHEEQGGAPVPSPPLSVEARYVLDGTLLTVNLTVRTAPFGAQVALGVANGLDASLFAVYVNDTAWLNQTSPSPRVPVYSLRNWLVSPDLAVQVDYRDPLSLYYERETGGAATLSFEAAVGAPSLEFDLWVMRVEQLPFP